MIFSKKFVSDYVELPENIETIAEDMTRVGNEYDYQGKLINAINLIIGEVIECEMHPESDHLHITKINIGNEILNIVCGAPNMRKGIKVIVAMDGAVLPGGTIKKSTIRGAESNGMCCSIAELGLDKKFLTEKDIDGIHELPLDAPIGKNPLEYLELDDEIIDFELTSNRSDLLSAIGLAYEVGAIYDRKVTIPKPNYKTEKDNFEKELKVNIDTPYCSQALFGRVLNVEIKESPTFIKNRLIACGIRPINNIVDISNYVMLETGQPLHFYDADLVGNMIGVRMAKENEKLKTLDGIERTLSTNDIVIYNNEGPIGLAGVMGGCSTEINENTKNILIESAIFDPGLIRKTAKKILRSEASSRFEKGLDLKRSYLAMERSKELLSEYAQGTISEYTHIYKTKEPQDKIIKITLEKINSVLGMNLTTTDVSEVFRKLDFECITKEKEFEVTVPSRRLDISIQEDLIEEVGRIYGVDNIEAKLPVVSSTPGHIDKYIRNIKTRLSSLGLNEVITYSLVNENTTNKFTTKIEETINVLEPMTAEKTTLRTNLTPSLMEVYDYNKARNNKNLCIFEIGECFYKENDNYKEENHLGILMTGKYIDGINTNINVDFYYIKGIIENLLDFLGYNRRYDFTPLNNINELHPYQSANIIVNGQTVGYIGKIHPSIYKEDVYVLELNLNMLKNINTGKMKYKEISKYPSIKKDLSFILDKNILASEVINNIKKNGNKTLINVNVYDEYITENERSLTFTLTFMDENKTLTEEEITPIIGNVIDNITKKYNAKLKNV